MATELDTSLPELEIYRRSRMSDAYPVFDAALAYQKTAALAAAVRLDIFTMIGAEMMTADDIASRIGASTRGLRVLCDYLTVIGLLKKEDSGYSLTHIARIFLDGSSPLAMGSIVDFLAAPDLVSLFFSDPTSYIRRGGSNGLASAAPDNPLWVWFAQVMAPLAALTAKRVAAYVAASAEPSYTLDVAAGHGLYGIEIAKVFPEAVDTAVDSADVLAIAHANAESAGVSNRLRMMLASTPGGDAYTASDLDEMARNVGSWCQDPLPCTDA